MNKTLPEVISNILTLYGAIVSPADGGELDYLAPKEISEKLGIPEYGKIGFSQDLTGVETIPGYYVSELFRSIEKLFFAKTKFSAAAAPPFIPNEEKLLKVVPSAISFSNATFRIQSIKQGKIPYVLVFFKYQALSDDKKEGLCAVLVNILTASTIPINEDTLYYIMNNMEDFEADAACIQAAATGIIRPAYLAASSVVKEKLKDFTKSLERRLNRDIKRVYEYYGTLKKETEKYMEKIERKIDNDEIKKARDKLIAIEAEQKWKIQDLVSKYVLKISLEPLLMIHIETQSTILGIDIKRRDAVRAFPLAYNSFLKRLDPLPCEACFYPQGAYYVCDEHLHLVCARCFKVCAYCGKKYCAACFKGGCPKCGKR